MNFDGPDWGGGGFFPFGHIIGSIVTGFGVLLCLLVLVGLIFLLVRFLLVATKAAQVYLANNSPREPVASTPAPAVSTTPTTVAPAAAKPTTTTKPATATTKPSNPKTP